MCDHCKVQLGWNTVCFQCKDRVAQGMQGQGVAAGAQFGSQRTNLHRRVTSPEAKQALAFAIVGLFCFGLILGIVAIIKANDAKRRIRRYGHAGEGLATAAFVIGIIDIVFGAFWGILWMVASAAS